MEKDLCHLCGIIESRYSCPKCNVNYCSVSCYRSKNHLECSESFYEKLVSEELKNFQFDFNAKRKMLDIFWRSQAPESGDIFDSDDEESIPDLASRMLDVNLDDEKDIWEKLTSKEKQEFKKLIVTGNILKILPEWEPWWKTKKRKVLIQNLNEQNDWKSKCPEVPSNIPKLLKLTKANPSPSVACMLLNVLLSYVFTVRWFKGAHRDIPIEGITTCISLSGTLRCNEVFKNFGEAIFAFENDLSECKWIKSFSNENDGVYNKNIILEDLVDIIKESNEDDLFFCVKAAICDLNFLCTQALLIIQEDKPYHLKRFSGPIPEMKLLQQISKKMDYYLSWTVDYGSLLTNFLKLTSFKTSYLLN